MRTHSLKEGGRAAALLDASGIEDAWLEAFTASPLLGRRATNPGTGAACDKIRTSRR